MSQLLVITFPKQETVAQALASIKDIEGSADLTEVTSALFLIGEGDPAALLGALKPYEGHVYQTSIDAELEREVNAALRHES